MPAAPRPSPVSQKRTFMLTEIFLAATANAEDFDEQKEKLSNVAYPITSKLYGQGGAGGADGDDEPDHDEL